MDSNWFSDRFTFLKTLFLDKSANDKLFPLKSKFKRSLNPSIPVKSLIFLLINPRPPTSFMLLVKTNHLKYHQILNQL